VAARTYWSAPVGPLTAADGTPVTAATLTDATSNVLFLGKTIPAGMLEQGSVLRLRARGELTIGSTADTLTLGFYYGGIAGAAIAAGAALAVVVSETAVPWWMEYEGEIRTTGTAGTIKGSGLIHLPGATTGLATAQTVYPIPQTAAARTVTIDTSLAKVVTVGAAWSATTGAPTLTCYSLSVEILG